MAITGGIAAAVGGVAGAAKGLMGGGGGSGGGDSKAYDQAAEMRAQQAADLWNNIQTPTLNTTPYSGQTWLQDFVPQTYQPWTGQVSQIQDSPEMRMGQLQALAQEQALAKGGLQPTDLITLQQIQQQQAGAGTSQAATAADALRNRGLGGAGAEYAARLAANQGAENQGASLYDAAMKAAFDRQQQAITQSGTMAGNIRTGDVNVSTTMANINNQFNTELQNLRTNAAQWAAQAQNAAQSANLAGRQGVANQNVTIGNQNLDRVNQLLQQGFNNQTTKIAGQTNALNKQQTLASAEAAAASQRAAGADQSSLAGLSGLSNAATAAGKITNDQWQNSLLGSLFNGNNAPGTSGGYNNGSDLVNSDGTVVLPPPDPNSYSYS
jgi:hypothetical protein